MFDFSFFFVSISLGIGLAMDAFSVSLANGLNETDMKRRKVFGIAGIFAFCQALMPMIGWVCVHTIVKYFKTFEKMVPWIALLLLAFIGGKMINDSVKNKEEEIEVERIGIVSLIVQGIATSIDALSVGFTIASYDLRSAITAAVIIATVTFAICTAGVLIGRKAGTKLAGGAGILGGAILIFIGIEIFVMSFL